MSSSVYKSTILCDSFKIGVTIVGGASDAVATESASFKPITLLDGAFLPANTVQQKVWRLQEGESPSLLSLLRNVADGISVGGQNSNDFLGKRLSDFGRRSFRFHQNSEEGTFDAAVDFLVPDVSGVYRIPFCMVRTNEAGVIVSFGQRKFIDFCVANVNLPGEKQAVLRQAGLAERLRHGPSITSTWRTGTESSLRGATLVIAFASWSGSQGRDWDGERKEPGGCAEFASAFRRAGIGTALFVKDPLRAWYLRGVGTSGHTFESVVSRMQEEIALVQPSKVVTLGSSMCETKRRSQP